MNAKAILLSLALTGTPALAFPPAPHHEVFGIVRDELGNPLAGEASVTFSGPSGDVLTGVVDPTIARGVNYSMKLPMDAGTISQLYQNTALRPMMPFTARVTIAGIDYLPIEVQGGDLAIGEPGGRSRLDLTLGIDRDGDGLPDAWEDDIIALVDGVDTLEDVTPDGDSDGDGVSNLTEYLAGTYAFDRRAVFGLEIVGLQDGLAQLRFLSVKGRSYQLLAGEDGGDFSPVGFRLSDEEGAPERESHYADSIRFLDVYVPAELVGTKLFRLHVE